MRAFFGLFDACLEARKLLWDYGYPFSLFIFIRNLYPHKRDQMKCLPAFSTDSFRSSSSVWALFVGVAVLFFFSPPIPQRAYGNQNHQCRISQGLFFLLVVNYDNEIHTHMHTGFSSQRCSQNSIILFYAGSNTFRQKASSN